MQYFSIRLIILAALFSLGTQAQAILLTPGDCNIDVNCWTSNDNTDPSPSSVKALVGTTAELTELYKAEVGIGDSGLFADSYDTTFSNSTTDPADALIKFITGTDAISCPDCYITIKDGNKSPALYAFDISSWDGAEDISLQHFWEVVDMETLQVTGAISNITIWGSTTSSNVPEPATLALLGLGLIGISFSSWRKRTN